MARYYLQILIKEARLVTNCNHQIYPKILDIIF